jgi:hypothetical protein
VPEVSEFPFLRDKYVSLTDRRLIQDGCSTEQLKQEISGYIQDMHAAYTLEQEAKQFVIMTQVRDPLEMDRQKHAY